MKKLVTVVVFALAASCENTTAQVDCESKDCANDTTFGQLSTSPDINQVGVNGVKQWANDRIGYAERTFASTGLRRQPSPGFWGAEIVYQVQVDRFNNGDLSNDGLNLPPNQVANQNGNDVWGLPEYRQGGDLKGVTQRLDYLRDLGITALWLTPVLKHNGEYHGYCTTDFTWVDPGFGTNDDLRELVAQAHARGIKVVLDIVINHMCDRATSYSRAPNHQACANDLNASYWSGAQGSTPAQGQLGFSQDFFGPLKSQFFFNRCGANSMADMTGTAPPAVFGDFTNGMFDFDTRNYDFQEIFTNLHKYWIAYADIDGFRLDAAKHVTVDFTAYFSTQARAYASSLGKKNFLVMGEVAGPQGWIGRSLGKMFSDPLNPNTHGVVPQALTNRLWTQQSTYLANPVAPYPGLNAVFNFALSGSTRATLLNQQPSRGVEDAFNSDYYRTLSGQGDARLNWNVLEIHDWPRFAKDRKADPFKSQLGVSVLPLLQGAPVIYYGIEQGFNGDCHFATMNAGAANGQLQQLCSSGGSDALYRQNMFIGSGFRLGSTVPELDRLAYLGKANKTVWGDWQTDPYLNRSHAVFKASRRLNAIRMSCNALKFGSTAFRWGEAGTEGLFAFSRLDGAEEIVVVVNTSPTPRAIPRLVIDAGLNPFAGQRYKNLLNGFQLATTTREFGTSYLNFGGLLVDGNQVAVFAPERLVSPWNSYLEAHQCTDNPRL